MHEKQAVKSGRLGSVNDTDAAPLARNRLVLFRAFHDPDWVPSDTSATASNALTDNPLLHPID